MTIADSTAEERVEIWRRLVLAQNGVQPLAQDNKTPNEENTQEVDALLQNLAFALSAADANTLRTDLAAPAGASLVGFDPSEDYPVGTVGYALNGQLGTDAPFAYKSTVTPFPYRHPQYDAAVALFGSVYPQSFYIDPVVDEVLFLSATGQVTVFSWSTRAYLKTYNCPLTFVSENMVIKYIGVQRLLYLRGTGTFQVFDITTTTQWQVLAPITTYPINAQRNFAEHAGEWLITSDTVMPLSQFKSRGYFGVYDAAFAQTGNFYLNPLYCGINEGPPFESAISKMQGMDFDGTTIYLGMGGYWNGTTDTNKKYGAYGVRTLTRQGAITGDYLLDPEKVVSKLISLGYHPDHCENEGVQFVKSTGKLYSLLVGMQSSTDPELSSSEGLYILEEFSAEAEAIDFSDCATSLSTFPDAYTDSSRLYPRSATGLINPLNGVAFATWAQVLDYMVSVDMSCFRYYSSTNVLTDFNGVALPSGFLVSIHNCNNSTFLVFAETTNSSRCFRLIWNGAQTEFQFRPTLSFVPSADNTLSNGTASLRWSDIRSFLGTFTGPVKFGEFTLTTLPSASANNGYFITVTNATGGPKLCRSNGTVWQIANTTTTVS